MKFITAFLLTALLSFVAALFCPWWIIAVVAFTVAAAIPQRTVFAFLSAAMALFFLWGIQTYMIDVKNDHILSAKVAGLLIHRNSPVIIIFITASLGALVSGCAAVSGSLFRRLLSRKKEVMLS